MGRIPRILAAAGAAGALALAGCSDSDSSAADPTTTATTTEAADAEAPAGVVEQYTTVEEEIAAEGGETTSGPWRVGYIVEAAEPWFEPAGAEQQFREPAPGENYHIEIIPFEASTGRIVPDVPITLEVVGGDGQVVDSKQLNFYYSTFFHYADNFVVPDPGTYTLRATLGAPMFFRHGEAGETPPLTEGATVEFTDVELAPPN